MDEYARPVLVMNRKGNWAKGSARSIDGYHLVEAFDHARDCLASYGGHAKAAGFSLETKHLENLYDKLLDLAEVKLKDKKLLPHLYIESEIEPNLINYETLNLINKFEPFGLGNPRPTLMLKNIVFSSYTTCGMGDKHLRGLIRAKSGQAFSFIGFDLGWWQKLIKQNKTYDIAFYLDKNEWNGEKRLELRILDIKETI
jgi:single-stranded-DNA-specific exonuclease